MVPHQQPGLSWLNHFIGISLRLNIRCLLLVDRSTSQTQPSYLQPSFILNYLHLHLHLHTYIQPSGAIVCCSRTTNLSWAWVWRISRSYQSVMSVAASASVTTCCVVASGVQTVLVNVNVNVNKLYWWGCLSQLLPLPAGPRPQYAPYGCCFVTSYI